MMDARYDQIDVYYANFVKRSLDFPNSVTAVGTKTLLSTLHNRLKNATILDLACGEGHLSRALCQPNNQIMGVDISHKLLTLARQKSMEFANIQFIQDDAQKLEKIATASIDIVVCNMALMDIPNINMAFQTIWRILKQGGVFIFSILHPCFESPFRVPESQIEIQDDQFKAVRVSRYLEEGYWNSGGDGMRGRVGAYHRTLSTYMNTLIEAGFEIVSLDEPRLPKGSYERVEEQWFSQIPRLLIVEVVKLSKNNMKQ